jgi:hypothetical protein
LAILKKLMKRHSENECDFASIPCIACKKGQLKK